MAPPRSWFVSVAHFECGYGDGGFIEVDQVAASTLDEAVERVRALIGRREPEDLHVFEVVGHRDPLQEDRDARQRELDEAARLQREREEAERPAREAKRKAAREKKERAEYERLRARFEGQGGHGGGTTCSE